MKFRGIWSHDCSWLQVNRRKYQSLRKENFLRLFSFFSLNLRLIENVDLKSLVFFSFKSCHENVNLKSSVFFLLSHVMKIWLTHNVARPSVGLNNCDDQSFISYLLRFPIESVVWKTHTEIFSSNHNRESTFSHVGKAVSSNQKSAVRMNQSVRKRVHVFLGASSASIFIHRSL